MSEYSADDAAELPATARAVPIERHGLGGVVSLKGWAPWTMMAFVDQPSARKEALRTLFLLEMIRQGIFTLGSFNICYRHDDHDIARVGDALDTALGIVAQELATGSVESRLGHPVIEPVFQVRP